MDERRTRNDEPLWKRPESWGAASALCVAAAGLPWVFPEFLGGGAVLGALSAVFGGLAVSALVGCAWTPGRTARRDPLAGLMLEAAEASSEAHLITGTNGVFVYANPAFHRLFALAVDLDAVAAILKGEDSTQDFARVRSNALSGIPDHVEVAIRAGKDVVEWRRLSTFPIPDSGGHVLWRAEDVTARRELEAAQRYEESMLADFLDHLPVGFFSADKDGRILFVNRTLVEWLELSGQGGGVRGARFGDFVVDGADRREAPEVAGKTPEPGGEIILRGRGGETFRAFLVPSEVTDANGEFLRSRSVVLRNVSSLDGAESGHGLKRRLHWLYDEAPVGIVLFDLDGAIGDCNRAFLKLLGLHRDAVVGLPLADRISLEDRADTAAQLSKVVLGASRAAHLDVRLPGIGGRELAASLYASREEDDDGGVSGLILHFIETTEKKHLEAQFAQSQKMQAVGQLAGGVAHDFNNLLTAMIGFSDLLLERHGPGDPSFADIMQIQQNANRATNLVRQLLAFSRKQTLKPVLLDITEALSHMSNLLRRLIGENIELVMEHGRDLGMVRVDPGQFDQVIVNLAVNARDAMPGGGTLSIRISRVIFEEPLERGAELVPAGQYVLIEVGDTGVGIPKENIGRIFEPFFSTKEVGAGTGLGLPTVYGIIRQTDGFVFVDSAPGQGTAFSIYLPEYSLAEAKAIGGETSAASDPASSLAAPDQGPELLGESVAKLDLTGTGTVLLVEDEDAVRMFGARALRNKGYQVLEADNGENALDLINSTSEEIDLIISDVVMPGMDGHTLMQLVRQEMPHLKFILISGYAEDVAGGRIEQDPSIRFLPKPFSLKELAGAVKEVMGV